MHARGGSALGRKRYSCAFSRLLSTSLSNTFLTGVAAIVDDANAHREPSKAELEEWHSLEHAESLQQLQDRQKASSLTAEKKSMTKEAIARRSEREQQRAAISPNKPSADEEQSTTGFLDTASNRDPSRSGTPSSKTFSVLSRKIPTSSSELSWYEPSSHVYSTIEDAQKAGVWFYPSTRAERARCGVYRALWEKGYYMGPGVKFGGEFLVYPGATQSKSHFAFTISALIQ
jgi:tRNA-splicing endonuclease subunit Sen34